MKRDLDLARQLLIDIQGHGPECAIAALRPGAPTEHEERVRCHVRLLIDAGLVKEIDIASGGAPCVRLTNAGHELLELAHNEARWREATRLVYERTGGTSLTAIRAVLTRWAVEASLHTERSGYYYDRPVVRRPHPYRTYFHRVEPKYRDSRYFDPADTASTTFVDRDAWRESPYYFRSRPAHLERYDWREPLDWRDLQDRELYSQELYARNGFVTDYDTADESGISLPIQVI